MHKKNAWYLVTEYYANEKVVSDGEVNSEGKKLPGGMELLIFYCPYCGQRL